MGPGNYSVRVMRRDEVDLAVDWAAREGWNPGIDDARCFHAADTEGFLIGMLDGEPVGCISAVRYDDGFGFLGFYIVEPSWRGRGYGLRLWEAAMAHLGDRVVGLDGVVEQQGNYARSGFRLAHRNIRFRGLATGQAGADPASMSEPVVVSAPDFARVSIYDRPLFPAGRDGFLRMWLAQEQGVALALAHREEMHGYGVARPCRQGWKVGPLFADTPAAADRLLSGLTAHVPAGDAFYLDVPAVNPAALALAARYGMEPVFETARMYKGAAPALPLDRIYGITSYELG